ncbi:MAG: bifunctional 5,10-methylenetetrahydrofolate dehydrogenase/5,10-methenyltetrahydrofolate cyclohydrolase [Erysipelotrichales bacterium]|nr:bifunctional 5,10-methylenetetrahydrofolate dehydrogenase/5,10-methenyltetrahydrofolate cyclohydrolase [Erysipelotrichales bacterium]
MIIKEYVALQKDLMRDEISKLVVKPTIAIIQVNDDEASNAYVKGKLNDAQNLGIISVYKKLPTSTTEEELINLIKEINEDDSIHGLIVQMPLPKHINEENIKLAVSPIKDVDGFHPLSSLDPCTPKGIIDYLKYEGIKFEDQNAVVIGRSNIVGKPMAKMLTNLNCNTVILHSRTSKENMDNYLRNADIIVIAIGKKWFLNEQEFKTSAVIVDVGINRDNGKLYGDAKPDLNVRLQTPVPGGVGLLTRLTLMRNLLDAYYNQVKTSE